MPPSYIETLTRQKGTAFVAVTRAGAFLLRAKPEAMAAALAALPERQRQLDLTQLHSIVLDRLLGLDAEKVREQTNLRYLRDAQEAVEQVRRGEADVAFLTNPVTMEQLREVAFAGEVMPQKSTDFLSQAAERPGHLCAGVSGDAEESHRARNRGDRCQRSAGFTES